MRLTKLENRILDCWESESINDQDPYEFILDMIGIEIVSDRKSLQYILSLTITEFSDAIAHGFDDLSGFAFFYIVRYLTKETEILSKMLSIKPLIEKGA